MIRVLIMCLASGSRFCLLCLLLYSCHAQADEHDHGATVSKTTEDMYDVAESMVQESAEAEVFLMEKDYFLNKLMTKYGNGVEMSYEGFEHLLHHLGLGGMLEFDHDAGCHKAENGTEFLELHIHHNHTDGSSRVLASKCANVDTHKHAHTHNHDDHDHPDDHNHEHTDDHNHEHTDDHNHAHTDDHNHEHTDDHEHDDHEHPDDHNHEHTDHKHHTDGNNTVHEHLHNETEHKKELGKNTDIKGDHEHLHGDDHEHLHGDDHEHLHEDDHEHLHEDDHEHLHEDDHAHHDHVHKRNVDYDECLPASVMLRIVNQDQATSISKEEFRDLCPSLIYQIDADSCHGNKDGHGSHNDHDHFHGDHAHGDHDHVKRVESAKIDLSKIPPKVWGFSAIAVIIISLVGLLGVAVIPIMQKVFYNHMLQFLVALAVGALSGDALLHLLPHAIGGGHGSGGHDHGEESHEHDTSAIYKGLCGLMGIYFFFFIERVLTIFTEYKRRKKRSKNMKKYLKDQEMVAVGERLAHTECDDMLMSIHPNKALQGYADEAHKESCTISLDDTKAVSHEHGHRHNVHQKETNIDGEENQSMIASHNSNNSSPNGHGHGHGHSHGADGVPDSVASVAWMVIMGDGIHNFSDGLAIGAAFANSITGGFSTSIAVFCHELPHEIGDFAMLLRAGMSAKQAVIYNCLSSVLCFIGMLIGVAIGNLEGTSLWIFAAVGGMFLYIALVDMLPELMSVGTKKGEHPLTHLLLQCIGMMIGAGIMLVIAVYEEDLMTILG